MHVVEQALGAAARTGGGAGVRAGGGAGHQRAAAALARRVQQLLAASKVVDHAGGQARAQHGRQRQLVAALGAQALGQRPRPLGRRARGSHELVRGGQLGAGGGRCGARRLDGALGLHARGAGLVGGLLGPLQRLAAPGGRPLKLLVALARLRQLALEPGQLARQPLLAPLVEQRQLALQLGQPAAVLRRRAGGVGLEQLELAPAALRPLGGCHARVAGALQAHADPLGGRPRRIEPRLQLLAALRVGGE